MYSFITVLFIIIMVYLLTALATKQAEKVHLQVKIVRIKKNINTYIKYVIILKLIARTTQKHN